ncbi:MAG: prepilin peptidase [Gammaproteobacteria bacterium]|nr:MAG: prepilin peptidase [Gammaproteobacteria bacterium]
MAVAAVFGLVVGSFLNVVIARLPVMMEREWREGCAELDAAGADANAKQEAAFNLVVPRSRCPQCGHGITALENIPLLSYAFLRGRCADCGNRISVRYPCVELLSGVLAALVAWRYGLSVQCVGALLLTWALVALTFIDLDTQLLPDSITLPFLWLGIGFNLFSVYTTLAASVIGAMAGYLSLWTVYHLFRITTGKEGMGFGDFKLLAAIGAWLGWQMLPAVILLSALVGAIVGITIIVLRGHDRNVPIPFGPYLAAAGWVALLWGPQLNALYLQWITPAG